MTKTRASRARCSAVAGVFVVAALVGVSGSCAETRFSLGETCLKDEDCLSGSCAQQRCVAASPVLDGSAPTNRGDAYDEGFAASPDSAPGVDSTGEGSADQGAGGDSADEGSTDAPLADGPADAAVDSPANGQGEGAVDAPVDSSTDGGRNG
jgi:hypothetical protein